MLERWLWIVWAFALSPIWGALLGHIWELRIRPRLVPAEKIKALAEEMIAKYGQRAEEFAFIEEDRAWRYSDSFEQGKWRRVRWELGRRHKAESARQH